MKTRSLYPALKEIDFIKLIPSLFASQKKGYSLLFLENEGAGFSEKDSKEYSSFSSLEEATWTIPYSRTYLALVKDEFRSLITFSGQEQVISYRLVGGVPILDFYKDKTKKYPISEISEQEKKSLLEEIKLFFSSLK
jgi:hypothetical protein